LTLSGCASAHDREPVPATPEIACTLRHKVEIVDTLKALPRPVRTALLQQAGAIADRGEFFNAGDAVSRPAPFNRFIRAGKSGNWWFVWYEHGGIAYWREALLLSANPRSGEIAVRTSDRASGGDLCTATDQLLDGAGTKD
jgi:hypothetical protein